MDSKTKLEAQVKDLEAELTAVKLERDRYLAEYRAKMLDLTSKVAVLTSTADEQRIKQNDLKRQLERFQKGPMGETAKQNPPEPAMKQEITSEDSDIEIIDAPTSLLKLQKRTEKNKTTIRAAAMHLEGDDSDVQINDQAQVMHSTQSTSFSASPVQKLTVPTSHQQNESRQTKRAKANANEEATTSCERSHRQAHSTSLAAMNPPSAPAALTRPSPHLAPLAIPLSSLSNAGGPSHHSTPSNRQEHAPDLEKMQKEQQKVYAPARQNVAPVHEEDEEAPPTTQPPSKRRSLDEDVIPPNAKRVKTSVVQAPGPSKRRSTRKKSIEAVQIASQNAKYTPQMSHAPKVSRKGKEKASDGASMQIVPLHAELQNMECMKDKYKLDEFPRCFPCTSKLNNDSCRFQGIRSFLRDAQQKIVGINFSKTQMADLSSMKFPKRWNEERSQANIKRTKITVARALLPTLHQELKHLREPQMIRWPREHEVRVTCDTCMTSIFSSSWLCRTCGREVCAECYATISELAAERPSADKARQAEREKHAHRNSILLQCNIEPQAEHQARNFSPVSRFEDKELSNAIKEMEELLKEEGIKQEVGVRPTGSQSAVQNGASSLLLSSQDRTTGPVPSGPSRYKFTPDADSVQGLNGSSSVFTPSAPLPEGCPPCITTKPFTPSNLSSLTLHAPTIPIRRFADGALTQEKFPLIWALGEPLVITDLLHKFRIEWTPEYFIAKYGQKACKIIKCEAEPDKSITMGEFFKEFGQYKNRKDHWDLLPESTPFKQEFPELYEDLSNALPVPSYVRSDGVLNIASHFPADTVAPDLGPRMDCMMATTQAAGSDVSLLLRVDMVDVLNIMTYASPAPDGSSGCAVWDIYRTEDSEKLRAFLTERVQTRASEEPMENGDTARAKDPVHGKLFYLDEELRAELYDETRVKSYRFYQRPGDAVFIPAGCAYQFASLADCVTVCVDFVTSESVKRCERQTQEFREQNQHEVWKEDVLQLRTMMWFAWLSCRQQEGLR